MTTTVVFCDDTAGSKVEVHNNSDVNLGIETINDTAAKEWTKVQEDFEDFSVTNPLTVEYPSAPTTGNLLVAVMSGQLNVRIAPPAPWIEIVDAGATGRAIAIYVCVEDGTIGTNTQTFTCANWTGRVTLLEFSGPVPKTDANVLITGAATSALGVETVASAATDTQAPAVRAIAKWPMLRICAIGWNGAVTSPSFSGLDNPQGIITSGPTGAIEYAVAWDKELASETAYTTGEAPTVATWSWTTSRAGSDVIVEIQGIGLTSTLDGATPMAGASTTIGVEQVATIGMIFDTSAVGTDDISSAHLNVCVSADNLTTTKKLQATAGKLANGTAAFTTDYAEIARTQASLPATLAEMTGTNLTTGLTNYNDLNGATGLNDDTALKAHINKTGTTLISFIVDDMRTTFVDTTENVILYGAGTAGTTSDPYITITHAAPSAGVGSSPLTSPIFEGRILR